MKELDPRAQSFKRAHCADPTLLKLSFFRLPPCSFNPFVRSARAFALLDPTVAGLSFIPHLMITNVCALVYMTKNSKPLFFTEYQPWFSTIVLNSLVLFYVFILVGIKADIGIA